MAQEINYTVSITASKGALTVTGQKTALADMVGTEMICNIQTTSTTGTAVVLGSVNPAQFLYIRNADATNNIQVGLDAAMTNRFATLSPGQALIIPNPPAAVYLKAVAGTPNAEVVAVE